MIFVTGGAGFIGANFVHDWLALSEEGIVNLDRLSYAGNLDNLSSLRHGARHIFLHGDVSDAGIVTDIFERFRPRAVLHFAAESHVDRSIDAPGTFVHTNIVGTYTLLEAARRYWQNLAEDEKEDFRFLHVSTDEVYGTLGAEDAPFSESTAYAPNSPYAASKAAADHLARAYCHTYGLPVLVSNCSNNYGRYQYPEKLIPLVVSHALAGEALPIYGDGMQIRDWLYVGDHCSALREILAHGTPGESYNIGGRNERSNLEVVNLLCDVLDRLAPRNDGASYREQMVFVGDRPGHDKRYAVDTTKIECELGWLAGENFVSGIEKTVAWYLEQWKWTSRLNSVPYHDWLAQSNRRLTPLGEA